MGLIATVMISSDDHLSSSNRGLHIDYAKESLYYFRLLGEIAEKEGVTHWIKAGDLTYGRFGSLEYRELVEQELIKQNKLVNGNYWIVKGNHDKASYGMTEFEYYLRKGWFRPSENIRIGNVNISMVDYNQKKDTQVEIDDTSTNIIVTHGYFSFEGKTLNLGKPFLLDNFEKWYGADYIVCGHIHQRHVIKGAITKDNNPYETIVHYLPCLSRPSYIKKGNPEKGSVVLIKIYDDGTPTEYIEREIPLLPLEESFNLDEIKKLDMQSEIKHVDMSDIVSELDNHQSTFGNPEDIIMAKEDVQLAYRQKAVELIGLAYK